MSHDGLPVIIGSGLGGTMVSQALSNAAIPHVLIGAAPGSGPRVGESLNLEGSLGLWELFPQFTQFYLIKKLVVGYMGDYVLTCDFDVAKNPVVRGVFRLLRYSAPHGFLHLDRVGLDAAVFSHVVASRYCTRIDARVTALEHDAASDRITAISLDDGSQIRPAYVFDATNLGQLVSRAVDLERTYLSPPQRTVYTHYHADGSAGDAAHQPWEHSSNILRLLETPDGIDAAAWCIPLGNYVSIGVSISDGSSELSDDALLERVEQAYARRGLRYRERFPVPTQTLPLRHRYFVHERHHGVNWLLVGSAACQIWWMSGSGVGSAYAAAQVATDVLDDPLGAGQRYTDYMRLLVNTHDVFDWFACVDQAAITEAGVSEHADGFIRGNVMRLAKSKRTRERPLARLTGDVLYLLANRRIIARRYCPVNRAALDEQTSFIFGRSAAEAA